MVLRSRQVACRISADTLSVWVLAAVLSVLGAAAGEGVGPLRLTRQRLAEAQGVPTKALRVRLDSGWQITGAACSEYSDGTLVLQPGNGPAEMVCDVDFRAESL